MKKGHRFNNTQNTWRQAKNGGRQERGTSWQENGLDKGREEGEGRRQHSLLKFHVLVTASGLASHLLGSAPPSALLPSASLISDALPLLPLPLPPPPPPPRTAPPPPAASSSAWPPLPLAVDTDKETQEREDTLIGKRKEKKRKKEEEEEKKKVKEATS